jgi:hypothetical protein
VPSDRPYPLLLGLGGGAATWSWSLICVAHGCRPDVLPIPDEGPSVGGGGGVTSQ